MSGERLQDHWSSGYDITVKMILCSINEVEWPTFGEERTRLTVRPENCNIFIHFVIYFPFWFRGRGFGSDCTGSWSFLNF